MSEENKKKPKFQLSLTNIIATISAALALMGSIIAFDARYAKEEQVLQNISDIKDTIIREMRSEIIKNRTVMINEMQREADDIEYQIEQFQAAGQPIPRFLSDKYKQITRQIEMLKNDTNN